MTPSGDAPLTLARVLTDPPAIHGEAGANASSLMAHGLIEDALRFIERTVRPGDRTLETGSGYSTILFALLGAQHTCIVPDASETERITAYLAEQGVSADGVDFIIEPSERVLPKLNLLPHDLVLIDGSHSFPQVFIDWFYVATALKVGGHLLVDDIHVWTGRVLRGFLAAEPEWELVTELSGRTAVFRKIAEVDPDRLWTEQRYVARRSGGGVGLQAQMAWSMLRHGQSAQLLRLVRRKLRNTARR
jgi:predicted O-methyltransferase YrrM